MTPTEPRAAHRVLLVDDDGAVRAMMNEGLQRKRFEVTTAASVTEALRRIATESFDVLINRGMEIWKTLRVSHIPTPPATTTDNCLTRRYTNIPLGTKNRSGHYHLCEGLLTDLRYYRLGLTFLAEMSQQ